MCTQHILDFAWEYIETAGNDHVLGAIYDIEKAIVVQLADIPGVKPSAGKRLGSLFWHILVAFHNQRTANTDFARLSAWHLVALGIAQAQVNPRAGTTAGG